MRKLSEIKNEDALDVLAEILEPVMEIAADQEVKKQAEEKGKLAAAKMVMKNHKESIMIILAALDDEPVETYEVNIIQIPVKILQLLNDKDLMDFFQSQGLTIFGESSGSATESLEETETK